MSFCVAGVQPACSRSSSDPAGPSRAHKAPFLHVCGLFVVAGRASLRLTDAVMSAAGTHAVSPLADRADALGAGATVDVCPLMFSPHCCFSPPPVIISVFVDGGLLPFLQILAQM